MDVETIRAIGEYIVTPICVAVAVVVFSTVFNKENVK